MAQQIPIEVIVHYPKQARAGVSYIMTVDLSFAPESISWPFEREEVSISCLITSPLFAVKFPPEPVFTLHRFGGTYGGLSFLLKAVDRVGEGEITLLLVKNGVLLSTVDLEAAVLGATANLQEAEADSFSMAGLPGHTGCTLRRELNTHHLPINQVAWSPDGETLAACSKDGTVLLWSVDSGEKLRTLFRASVGVTCLAWSPDGEMLASGASDSAIYLYAPTGEAVDYIRDAYEAPVSSLAWSPDGRLLASGSYDTAVRIWDVRSGRLRRLIPEHRRAVSSLAWSPDGRILASGSADTTVRLWNRSRGTLVRMLENHTGTVHSLAWAPDMRLASGSRDATVCVWEPGRWRLKVVLEGHSHAVNFVHFSPDGRLLASGSDAGDIRLWRCDTWASVATLLGPEAASAGGCLAFHPREPVLATLDETGTRLRVWDLDYQALLSENSPSSETLATSATRPSPGPFSPEQPAPVEVLQSERLTRTESFARLTLGLRPEDFIWASGIPHTFVPQSKARHRALDEYELTGHYENWREDLALASQLGLSALQWGVPWYRVEPSPGEFDWRWTDEVIPYMVEEVGVEPIIDLIRGGCPFWLRREFFGKDYVPRAAAYAAAFARRYRGLVRWYTPMSEPMVHALMCGRRGLWPPYLRGDSGYIRILLQLIRGIVAMVNAIKEVDPESVIVHVEEAGLSRAVRPDLEALAVEEQRRAYLGYDLLTGRVTPDHPLYSWLLRSGAQPDVLADLSRDPIELDVIGLNFYPQSSARHLYVSTRGQLAYRIQQEDAAGFAAVVSDYYRRYGTPILLAGTNMVGDDKSRASWLKSSIESVHQLRAQQVPVIGYTWFPMTTAIDWSYRQAHEPAAQFHVESGLYRLNDELSRSRWLITPLADLFRSYIASSAESIGQLGSF